MAYGWLDWYPDNGSRTVLNGTLPPSGSISDRDAGTWLELNDPASVAVAPASFPGPQVVRFDMETPPGPLALATDAYVNFNFAIDAARGPSPLPSGLVNSYQAIEAWFGRDMDYVSAGDPDRISPWGIATPFAGAWRPKPTNTVAPPISLFDNINGLGFQDSSVSPLSPPWHQIPAGPELLAHLRTSPASLQVVFMSVGEYFLTSFPAGPSDWLLGPASAVLGEFYLTLYIAEPAPNLTGTRGPIRTNYV